MGGFCKCCETGCYELQPEDLPTVTPPAGWSVVSDWTGTACCKCLTMQPDTQTWTDSCSGVFGVAEQDYNCTWDILAWELPNPRVLTSAVCPSDGTIYCTTRNKFKAGEGVGRIYCREEWKLLVSTAPSEITLCISKQNVDCGSGPVEKWVLSSQYCYDVQTWAVRNRQKILAREITVTHSCFKKTASPSPATACDYDVEEIHTHECTRAAALDDVALDNGDAIPVESGIGGGTFCFCRHKLFDAAPTGSVTFTNADVLGACDLEFTCNSTGCDDSTQVCFSVSSWPCAVRPCWCDTTYEITEEIEQICYQQNCSPGDCGFGLTCVDPQKCVSFSVISPPDCEGIITLRCCLPVTDPGCFDVSNYVLAKTTPGSLGNCCRDGSTIGVPGNCATGAEEFGNYPICHASNSLNLVPFCIEPLFTCTALTCDATCCHDLDCDQCQPKYAVCGRDETSLTFDTQCGLSTVSVCISAPSWTLNLA